MNFVKKLLLISAIGAAFVLPSKALTISTNLPANGTYLLSTNNASVYSVEITSSSVAMLQFFDMDSLAAPYYGTNSTNGAWVGRLTYPTNYVTSFIGYNGYTNYYTNVGMWTISQTNAASTNALSPLFTAVTAGNTYAVYNVDALFSRGISVLANPCTNVSIVINYRAPGH